MLLQCDHNLFRDSLEATLQKPGKYEKDWLRAVLLAREVAEHERSNEMMTMRDTMAAWLQPSRLQQQPGPTTPEGGGKPATDTDGQTQTGTQQPAETSGQPEQIWPMASINKRPRNKDR